MGGRKKKGPAHKLPKRRHSEARVLEEPQYRQRKTPHYPHVKERCPDCGAPMPDYGVCSCWYV